jgi:hypothetical protein
MAFLNSFKSWNTSVLSLGLVGYCVIGLADVASAKTIQLLVQTGQILPQNSEPIEKLIEPTIGRDRQVVLIIQHRTKVTPPLNPSVFGSQATFIGMNAISPTNQVQLVDSTVYEVSGAILNRSFSAPSISEGKIAYIRQEFASGRYGTLAPNIQFKIGTTAGTTMIFDLQAFNRKYAANQPVVSLVNGRAFLLDSGPFFATGRASTVDRWDTRSTPAIETVVNTDATNRAIRTSADNLVLSKLETSSGTNVYRLFEKPIDGGSFKEVFPLGQNPASCGFAASYKNLAVCSTSSQGTVLSVRLGQQAPFVAIPLPAGVEGVVNPSMSKTQVMFQARSPKNGTLVDTIFLSLNGKAPTVLIQAGETLNNKTIAALRLSTNGRAIADQSAVFLADFTDGSTGLFRVDL